MTLHDIINLKPGAPFKFRGAKAEVIWVDKIEYLLHEGDPSAKDQRDKNDLFYRNYAVAFKVEGIENPITLVTCCPWAKAVEMPEYEK